MSDNRKNPDYPVGHCFTVVKCDRCGEYYEASYTHVCGKQNSYVFQCEDKSNDGESV